MLNKYNTILSAIGDKLRNILIFDIQENINHYKFFKVRFFKTKDKNNLILKFK